ncbi:unnamed protein product [Didymodactylos carnosus]|uniref:Uncharacterized protein n=1 Tax=Didymodactylos carnosus TaxID=1234261 RepID=A0A8S2TXV4_9BILA|nr:unnamed protein product [Didymodactylos carnosus]CAF4313092.1 unnamed protein product [Didymodactylos carnosus]
MWRFLAAGDDFVEIMNSRDLDSALTHRELAAVQDWLKTNKSFHAMRDHPLHNAFPILAGMWGFRAGLNRSFSQQFLAKLLDHNITSRYKGYFADQLFLQHEIWPLAKDDIIVHDSFLCQTPYGVNSRPFPTRRRPFNETDVFVGERRRWSLTDSLPEQCPLACRPKDHPDWTAC